MNDADIAPLAQRLAEENNVDWRRLSGSGANGRIVERDVLEYLARVMAGEESLDPTPEPLPDGLDAWPEEDAVAARGASERGDPPAPAGGGNGAAPPAAGGFAREATGGGVLGADDEDELLLAGDDLEHDASAAGDEPLLVPPSPEPAATPSRDLPDLFDDREPPATERGRGDSPALFDGAAGGDGGGAGAPAPAAGREHHDAVQAGAGLGGPDEGPDQDRSDHRPDDGGFDFGGLPGGDEVGDLSSRSNDLQTRGRDDEVARGDHERTSDRDAAARGPGREELRMDPTGDGSAGAGDLSAPPATAAGVGSLPLARSRQVLRRQVDLGNALALQRLLSTGGSAGNDVALTALLLMAARREAAALQVSRPGVATASADGRMVGATVPGTTLSEIAARLTEGDRSDDDGVDLLVADLSGYGLDDAVLDADVPQLTLGRILSDGGDGGVRATLALAGELPLDRGATFLARVAQLVEEPLRLLI